jgi:hypothetical protein
VAHANAHSQGTDLHSHSPSLNCDPNRGSAYSDADAHSNRPNCHDNAVTDPRTSNHHPYTGARYEHANTRTCNEHTDTRTRNEHTNPRSSNRNIYADTGSGLRIEHQR